MRLSLLLLLPCVGALQRAAPLRPDRRTILAAAVSNVAVVAPALAEDGDSTFGERLAKQFNEPGPPDLPHLDDGAWAEHKGPFEASFFDDFKGTSIGISYKFLSEGDGEKPVPGQLVYVDYSGYLLDGTKFDSSYNRGKSPFKFKVGKGKVIGGWDATVAGMRPGMKVCVKIPPEYGYGDKRVGPIPPNSELVFFMEMVALGKKPKEKKAD